MSEDDANALLGSESAPVAGLPAWKKWVPFVPDFYTYHFGTDLLLASWLFLLSSAIWVGVEVSSLHFPDKTRDIVFISVASSDTG